MRGKRRRGCGCRRPPRIIPAHAGQTDNRRTSSRDTTDHPRACGANLWYPVRVGPLFGSSPRMRGKRAGQVPACRCGRIIPAHAGQTSVRTGPAASRPDHPRACGANSHAAPGAYGHLGSSPRMRGKQRIQIGGRGVNRIIPAHAGQTAEYGSSLCFRSDHPRACGANDKFKSTMNFAGGSSPRMRGKPRQAQRHPRPPRIIPAHAGQTKANGIRRGVYQDHPRACGANSSDSSPIAYIVGSSPRMRGKLGGVL